MAPPADVVVIGTGFGGATVALAAARAGLSVVLIERGRWVDRDASAWDPRAILLDRKYRSASPIEMPRYGFGRTRFHPDEAVGGKSVFYGAASFRLREPDFRLRERYPRVGPLVDWPISYADLAPFYDAAECLLGVAGVAGLDPTEPPRITGYGSPPPPLSPPAQRVAEAATALGLRPFPIPLAINFHGAPRRARCVQCPTCDLFPCKIGAKNDLAVTVLPAAIEAGATILARTLALRLVVQGRRVTGVECMDAETGRRDVVPCRVCVVSAGAIASAGLLLASGIGAIEPAGRWVGRCLMRHCSGIVIGLFAERTNEARRFHKQIALTDFYFGHPDGREPAGPWGMIQGLQVPPPEYIAEKGGFPLGTLGARTADRQIYLLCMAQDLPDPQNRVEADARATDRYGAPVCRVYHRYTRRDRAARSALYREAARVLRRAGAVLRVRKPINTFSHAIGTCRFGSDPATAALDPWCRFFGVPNLFVVDGSFMPTSGGVNPSLTIAANGIRVGRYIAAEWDRVAAGTA